MKNKLLLYIFLILTFTATVKAKSQVTNCENQILDYANFVQTDSTKWSLTLNKNKKKVLIYFGAIHSKNPSHNQFVEIENAWNNSKFDIALFEGTDRGILDNRDETIRELGESGFIRFLASKQNVKTQSLEPNPVEEIQYLSNYFSIEKIKLFFLLREAQRVRESFNWTEAQIKDHIQKLLSKVNNIPALNSTLLTLKDIKESFSKFWGNEKNWWDAPSNWFDPLQESDATGGIFTNDINRHLSKYRDIYMYKFITNLLSQNLSIFAVIGRNHVPMQARAIQCEWDKLNKQ